MGLTYGGISLPWFLGIQWEENQLGPVLLEPLHISLKRLNTTIASPVIYGNSDSTGKVLAKTGPVDFLQSKPTTGTDFRVVSDSWASDHGSERSSSWAWSDAASLLQSLRMTSDLTSWLIEPCLDVLLPILVEMAIRNHVITFRRHGAPGEKPTKDMHQCYIDKLTKSANHKMTIQWHSYHPKK